MMYFKVILSNKSVLYFDAIDYEAGNEYAKYKSQMQGAVVDKVIIVSKKVAMSKGLDVDETV